ncbi:autotransporter outer membrane beta-barrel domain-containing protein [Phascolarctobacterium sp.]|uniref:autotransporter outer membrane beta-barrel domain-containing protein n=1 Tax=Phascolarctobacterium sp. TaxID=2049039 RepID=UPI0025E09DD0|nr:autotransporter outer membrane beta-barrel domain-containing protein [Phascolarctobacterium sp.]
MSRKQMLTKKVAHTLLAMSIVSASGLNLWSGTAWAAADGTDGNDDIRNGVVISDAYNETVGGTAGTDGTQGTDENDDGGNGGKGGNASLSGTLTVNDSSKDVTLTVQGGNGGAGGANPALTDVNTGNGGAGGSAELQLTVAGEVQTGDLVLTDSAGSGGTGGKAGDGQFNHPVNGAVLGGGGAGGNAAAGIAITDGSLKATSITLTATAGNAGSSIGASCWGKDNQGSNGAKAGTASIKGLVLSGQQAAVKVANDIVITGTGGRGGSGGSNYGSVGLAAVGGAAEAYGLVAAGSGAYNVQFADLTLKATGGNGGNGGFSDMFQGGTNNSHGDPYLSTDGADGGSAVGKGLIVESGVVQLTANNITSTAAGGTGGDAGHNNTVNRKDAAAKVANAGQGGMASATGIAVTGGLADMLSVGAIKATATGGAGGRGAGGSYDSVNDGTDGEQGSVGGAGGEAYAYGLFSSSSTKITADSIAAEAAGGVGGNGGDGGSSMVYSSGRVAGSGGSGGTGGTGGSGGQAMAYGVYGSGSTIITTDNISVEVTGGTGGQGGIGGYGNEGVSGNSASSTNPATIGGSGGNGADGGSGGTGGLATAYGLHNSGGITVLTVESINAQATGGAGGTGGKGGKGGKGGRGGYGNSSFVGGDGGTGGTGGNGGNGGTGGSAVAYGLHSSGGITILTADGITAQANGGTGGDGSTNGTSGDGGDGGYNYGAGEGQKGEQGAVGQQGQDGQIGAQAEAYGVYAEKGAVITLSAKTDGGNGGTITIGAKAGNTETAEGSKAYAIYADNATVLFNDNAVLNSDGTSTDDTVITYLNNATLGFGTPGEGQNVGRTITGGTLQLAGSNTFKVATDLNNNNADKFTFAKLAADSSTATQYIAVGYDKAFDGSRLDSFVGDVTVLTVTNLEADQNLNNFVGKESEMDDPLTRFLATPTVSVDGNAVKITKIDFEEAGASETVMTAADAQMSIANLWRVEGNNLMKRMGDLRSDPEVAEGGVWARYYRGEMSADSAYDRSFDQDYTAFQGGIDKVQDYKGGKLYTGIAVNRIDSNAGYTSGSGDLSSTGVGVYASWLGSKGHYLDVIARGSKLANDFKLVDRSGNTAKGDYDTWAYGISAEYGYRQDLQGGWFVEPQAELSLGHIGSTDYTMSNGTEISQDAVNSAVTRIGVLSGKDFTMNGRQGNAYIKASLLHDFGGNGGGAAYYKGRSTVVESADMSGTWYEIGLGANLGLTKNSNLYFDALKTFGGDLRTEWQFNAGLRFTF